MRNKLGQFEKGQKAYNWRHGLSKSPIRNVHNTIKMRCINPNQISYHIYGGRGIKVCERWLDFSKFLEDMYPSYLEHVKKHGQSNTQIDRIDNSKDYTPENCKWVTKKENTRNKRNNVLLTYKGETKCLAQWAEELGVNYFSLRTRIQRGWTHERALSTPFKVFN